MSVLLGTDAKTLLTRLGLTLNPNAAGLSIEEIQETLERTGHKFIAVKYTEKQGSSGGGGPIRNRPQGIPEAVFARQKLSVPRQKVGVAYLRPDGTGHVVVLGAAGTPYRSYKDYQVKTAGEDVTKEVKECRIFLMFYLEKETGMAGEAMDTA
ncbi:hypothetical protein BZA77DRAFT_101999 [Pyronema omphalodes]|nr:hypothetical protein BZA77DRAFT_101999 [Pyronema omphalodes]